MYLIALRTGKSLIYNQNKFYFIYFFMNSNKATKVQAYWLIYAKVINIQDPPLCPLLIPLVPS